MAEKCESCGEKIETDEIGKIKGTIKKKKVENRNELIYFCSECQKLGTDKI
jgi:uncharacterized protein with PIN domain